jgi:DNA-directed RNA polymerase specialized sigma24 family protein
MENKAELVQWLTECGYDAIAARWGDDVAQIASMRFLRYKKTIRNPRAFLFRVARNVAINQTRHQHTSLQTDVATVERSVIEAREEVDHLLSRLCKKDRRLLLYVYRDGLTVQEAACRESIGFDAAKKRLQRALARCRKIAVPA